MNSHGWGGITNVTEKSHVTYNANHPLVDFSWLSCTNNNCTHCQSLVVLLVCCLHCYHFLCPAIDSKLAKLCAAHLGYDNKELQEPFGCVPTSSLIVQVGLEGMTQCVQHVIVDCLVSGSTCLSPSNHQSLVSAHHSG